MNTKRLSIILLIILTFTFSFAGFSYAETDTQAEYDDIKNQQEEVSNDLARVEADIEALQPAVDAARKEVEKANARVIDVQNQIVEKKEEMAHREDGLNERLRVMYKNGSIGYIDILLNSRSITELISNLEMIQLIYKNDIVTLDTLEKEQEELEKTIKQLKVEKAVLDDKKVVLDSQMAELETLKGELEAMEDELLRQAEELAASMMNKIDPDSEYIGGDYVWPTPSCPIVTSLYGWRIHPLFNYWKYHSGIDIGASYGANILAAASGTVILSQDYGGYGECIIIDHGGGNTTLYGHMNQRLVSVGDTVTGGELIGYVGDSGWSSGPHLHFEVTLSGELVDPLEYVTTPGLIFIDC